MEVTKANLATYLAGLAPSATPYPIEITETVVNDWRSSGTLGTVGNIINTNTPSGVYLDLGLTIIPSSVMGMTDTFRDCTSLTTAPIIPSSVISMINTFSDCTSLTTAPIIPSSVKTMSSTFLRCTSLTTVPIIPSSVTDMRYAFYICTLLHTIQNFAVDVDNCIMTNAFYNCPALANIYVTTLSESSWHLLHTDTDATGTDYTIYNPDGTVAGSGTVAGTSQVISLYGKSDELVISANITPTLAEETATTQVQWHKSGLPYDDELMIFNAKNPTTVISNVLITTIRKDANFTLNAYADGQKIRIANTHTTNTITCTLPTGQTMNGQSSFTIIAGKVIELELIGTSWIDLNNDYYSTTEQVIGKWIDGKPLYRKVVNFGALPNATIKVVAHGLNNIGFLKPYGYAYSTTGNYVNLPFIPVTALNQAVDLYISTEYIVIQSFLDRSNYTGVVVLEYTKTTD